VEDDIVENISEAWLKRLEQGQIVKLHRTTLELLCRALECSPRERVILLLYADRNVLGDSDEASLQVALAFNYILERLFHAAQPLLQEALDQRSVGHLNDRELLLITAYTLEMVLHEEIQDQAHFLLEEKLNLCSTLRNRLMHGLVGDIDEPLCEYLRAVQIRAKKEPAPARKRKSEG